MKRAALYLRVSTVDQHPETQLYDLRQMAAQRGFEIVQEYTDRISGVKAKRPGLDAMMADARHGQFDVVLVWASDIGCSLSLIHICTIIQTARGTFSLLVNSSSELAPSAPSLTSACTCLLYTSRCV